MSHLQLAMSPLNTRRGLSRLIAFLSLWNLLLSTACDRAPPEPEPLRPQIYDVPSDDSPAPDREEGKPRTSEDDSGSTCVIALLEPPPPSVDALAECPEDPNGRPSMPRGRISFTDAPQSPALHVELAQTDPDRAHGLMYVSHLADNEGMLFSWDDERIRSFWMKNTCLSLDMLFIDKGGTIVGILENVPPWNQRSRSIACPAAHVLEVRAGWTRKYGVKPGQSLDLSSLRLP